MSFIRTFGTSVAARVALALACALVAVVATVTRIGGADAQAARQNSATTIAALEARLKAYETRVTRLEDVDAINKLTRIYGYYVDKGQWSQIAPLWAEKDSSVEIAARGVYLGRKGAERLFLNSMGGGKDGLGDGRLFNHMILQGVVNVDPNGTTAKGRWRAWVQIGQYQRSAMWSEGIYENEYVKDNGIWMFKKMRFYPTFYTTYAQGWGQQALPNNGPSKEFPPDLPSSDNAPVYPTAFVPPYHYKNPVSGK